ncbi:hypothetical protein BZZ01_32505 [Nostocales cyanobacterium HT-58-2]|nr:hypothetical protein BZZ01_32505 [Nostocales cyanobacterium HT-58-2]
MSKYLIELKDSVTDDMALLQLEADSPDAAKAHAKTHYPECEVMRIKHTHGGARTGAGRKSPWGEDVVTERRRLPQKYALKAEDVISELEMVNGILECWQDKVAESMSKSANGLPSERYKYVAQLINDLKQAMQITSDSLV